MPAGNMGVALGSKMLVSATQIIHNIPQVYHVPSPPKYVHVPVPGPKIHKVAGGRAPASEVDMCSSCQPYRVQHVEELREAPHVHDHEVTINKDVPYPVKEPPQAQCLARNDSLHSGCHTGHHRQEALHRESSRPP